MEAENLNPCTKKEVSDVSLDVISFTQFAHEITERETGEKFWSSVSFVKGEVGFDQGSIDPKVLLEDQGQAVGDKKCVRGGDRGFRSGLVFNLS